jgi:hypothetical protein
MDRSLPAFIEAKTDTLEPHRCAPRRLKIDPKTKQSKDDKVLPTLERLLTLTDEPIAATSNKENDPAKLARENIDTLLPARMNSRQLIEEPKLMKSNALMADPNRKELKMLVELPNRRTLRTLIDDPVFTKSKIERDVPIRTPLRSDRVDAKTEESKIDMAPPRRASAFPAKTLIEEPILPHWRIERLLPSSKVPRTLTAPLDLTRAKTDKQLPNRVALRILIEEFIAT